MKMFVGGVRSGGQAAGTGGGRRIAEKATDLPAPPALSFAATGTKKPFSLQEEVAKAKGVLDKKTAHAFYYPLG